MIQGGLGNVSWQKIEVTQILNVKQVKMLIGNCFEKINFSFWHKVGAIFFIRVKPGTSQTTLWKLLLCCFIFWLVFSSIRIIEVQPSRSPGFWCCRKNFIKCSNKIEWSTRLEFFLNRSDIDEFKKRDFLKHPKIKLRTVSKFTVFKFVHIKIPIFL